MALPEPFPLTREAVDENDHNPAIRLFGKRFFVDQGAVDLLAEFLSVASFRKRVDGSVIDTPLPSLEELRGWPKGQPLAYLPPVRLSLKLLALLGASPPDSRHASHERQYGELVKRLRGRVSTRRCDADQVVEWLQDLLRGYQGAGSDRTWCAQTFFPLSRGLLARETLWNQSVADRTPALTWDAVVEGFQAYFSVSKYTVLARGGELLYLQLCNSFRAGEPLRQFARDLQTEAEGCLSEAEAEPAELHSALRRGLLGLYGGSVAPLDRLVEIIEGLDPDTHRKANQHAADEGWLKCEWCPEESWKEGYLFALELSRLLRAALDPVERLELMALGCGLQVLRSLCAQSARYSRLPAAEGSPLGYAWLFAPPEGAARPLRLASQRNLQTVQRLIHDALRSDDLVKQAEKGRERRMHDPYSEADRRYGHKLLLALGKKLGVIAPYRGPGARWVMTDRLVRYLVLVLLRPGERCTYEAFLKRLYSHYGIAVEGRALDRAAAWSGVPPSRTIQPSDGGWLAEALRAAGFLVELSDACSIVRNNFGAGEPLAREARR